MMKSFSYSKKDLLLSGKVLTMVVLIIFPSSFAILFIYTISLPIISNYTPSIYSAYLIILLVFAFIPAIYSTPKFFNKRGSENVIIEYQYMKNILYFSILILIAIILSNIIISSGRYGGSVSLYDLNPIVLYVTYVILPIVLSILIKLLLEHGRNKFDLYYAKGCFKIVSKETTDKVEKAKYLAMGLTWYNRFLRKNTNLQINDSMKIYSKIVTHSPLDTNKAVISISESFDSEDGLKPLRYLSAYFPDTEVGQILTKELLTIRIKESSDLIIPIITIIITIITTFLLPKPTH